MWPEREFNRVDIEDAYVELGVPCTASEQEVKAAWRKLVSQWHPDRHPGPMAVARMQRINLAYQLIRDQDSVEDAPAPPPQASPRPPPQPEPAPPPSGHNTAPPAGPPPPPSPPPRAVRRSVKLTLEEAALGCTRLLSGFLSSTCEPCEGRGMLRHTHDCSNCNGTGTARAPGWIGLFSLPGECTVCDGSGKTRVPCAACQGTGKAASLPWRLTVRIPAGARQGDVLHADGSQARAGHGAVTLDITIDLLPHPLFKLDDDGLLHIKIPIDGFGWMAQRAVDVPTLDGLRTLRMVREQRHYRLPAAGYPSRKPGLRGDLAVEVEPVFPARLSSEQQRLLDQLMAASAGSEETAPEPRLAQWKRDLQAWQRKHQQQQRKR